MDKLFSIIIPTMWRSDLIHRMLPVYEKSKFVGEIIIIDNDPLKTPNLSGFTKVRHYTNGENIYVNPAWNWGASLAKYNLIIANDDIVVDIDCVLKLILDSDFDVVGIRLKTDGNGIRIQQITAFPANSYGCFMYVKNYINIPEQLKIWYGDKILFYNNKKRGMLVNSGIQTNPSTTINSDVNLFRNRIGQNDRIEYRALNS